MTRASTTTPKQLGERRSKTPAVMTNNLSSAWGWDERGNENGQSAVAPEPRAEACGAAVGCLLREESAGRRAGSDERESHCLWWTRHGEPAHHHATDGRSTAMTMSRASKTAARPGCRSNPEWRAAEYREAPRRRGRGSGGEQLTMLTRPCARRTPQAHQASLYHGQAEPPCPTQTGHNGQRVAPKSPPAIS